MRKGRHSLSGMPPYVVSDGTTQSNDDRNSLYRSTGTPAAASHRAALVVQEPVPCLARIAKLPGMHEIVRRDR
jgi:hypothetical protein